MQLPRTISPAFCCLLALAVQHVAGLVVPRGAPGSGIGAEVGLEVDASLLGLQVDAEAGVEVGPSPPRGRTHRRQQDPTTAANVGPPGWRRQVAIDGEAQGEAVGSLAYRRQLDPTTAANVGPPGWRRH